MAKTIEKTIYTFGELLALNKKGEISDPAVQKAREWLQRGATMFDWWESTYDFWKSALAQIGFLGVDIEFSGFWCQGDGASFSAEVDADLLVDFLSKRIRPRKEVTINAKGEENFKGWLVREIGGKPTNPDFRYLKQPEDALGVRIVRDRGARYSHEMTCSVEVVYYGDEPDDSPVRLLEHFNEDLINEFEKAVEILRIDICRALYKALEQEYEWRTADEQLIEDSGANGWTFDEEGDREG